MMSRIDSLIRNTPLGRIVRRQRAKKAIAQWHQDGCPVPIPHQVKEKIILDLTKRSTAQTLIETGTFYGDMIEIMRPHFGRLFSIEIQPELARAAQKRFAPHPHITVLQGDSAEVLGRILKDISEPCVFWLDGHYSGANTGRGAADTPIAHELSSIFAHPCLDHIVLIDDARCFDGTNSYPTIEELRALFKEHRPDWFFEVKDDIIRSGCQIKSD